jgi:phosphoribosylglycinamide formyltransferase 2
VAEALQVPGSEIRLFGKPESFVKRRMGVALVHAESTDEARRLAKLVASRVKPHQAMAHERNGNGQTSHRIEP